MQTPYIANMLVIVMRMLALGKKVEVFVTEQFLRVVPKVVTDDIIQILFGYVYDLHNLT